MTTTQRNPRERGEWPHLVEHGREGNGPMLAMTFTGNNQFLLEAAMKAAGAKDIRDSQDPEAGRICHIATPPGTITVVREEGPLCSILEVDLPKNEYRGFWERLKMQADENPGVMQFRPPGWNGEITQDRTKTPTSEEELKYMERARFYQDSAILAAAQGDSIHRTHDPIDYRNWHVETPRGRISFWDTGNGRASIIEVNMAPEPAQAFWQRLREYVKSHPNGHPESWENSSPGGK